MCTIFLLLLFLFSPCDGMNYRDVSVGQQNAQISARSKEFLPFLSSLCASRKRTSKSYVSAVLVLCYS